MTDRLLVESYATVRVDREAGVIHDCLLLGTQSRNGVSYPTETREQAVALFEGAKSYLSHTSERSIASLKKPRRFEEQIGRYRGVHNTPEGVRGNFKVRKSHPYANLLFDMAEEAPDEFGLSAVMLGITTGPKGQEVCKEIKQVKSIDIVTDPATTRGLFEEEEPEEGPSAEQAYETACMQAVSEVVSSVLSGSMTPEEAAKKVKELLKQHMKAFKKDDSEEGSTEEPTDEPAPDAEMEEEYRLLKAEKECRLLCEDNNLEPDKELLTLLMDLPGKESRVTHLNYVKRSGLVRKVKSGYKTNPTNPETVKETSTDDLVKTIRSK